MAKDAKEKLAELEKQAAEIRSKMQAIRAKQSAEERKADTRRKILLGSALLSKAAKDEKMSAFVELLIAGIERDVDKKAFDGWKVPKPIVTKV